MPPAEPTPPGPPDPHRPFAREELFQRLVKELELGATSRVLELGVGEPSAGLYLARAVGCEVVSVTQDATRADAFRAQVLSSGAAKVEVRQAELAGLGLAEKSFDLILVLDRHLTAFAPLLQTLRPLLAEKGSLGVTYPVRVGRFPLQVPVDLWGQRLAEPLQYPRELLGLLVQHGLEPQWVQTLSDLELDDLYRAGEQRTGLPAEQAAALQEETALHRSQGGRASVTFALVLGRRKEPGEKPPTSRDRG